MEYRVITTAQLFEFLGRQRRAQPTLSTLQFRQLIAAAAERVHEQHPELFGGRFSEDGQISEATLRSLVHLFKELEPQRLKTGQLEDRFQNAFGAAGISQRAQDILLVYKNYWDNLERAGFMGPRGFDLLTLEESPGLRIPPGKSNYLFLGLDGLTYHDPEFRIAYALARNPKVQSVEVALVAPESGQVSGWDQHGADPLIEYNYTVAGGVRNQVEASDLPDGLSKFAADPFAYRETPVAAEGLALVRLPDAALEEEWIARQVKQAIVGEGLEPDEIAILDRNMDDRPGFERWLSQLGVPVVASFKRRVDTVPAVRAVRAVYALVEGGWRTRDLVAIAESPYFDFGLNPTILARLGSIGIEPSSAETWQARIQQAIELPVLEPLGKGLPADHQTILRKLPPIFIDFRKKLNHAIPNREHMTAAQWVASLVRLIRERRLENRIAFLERDASREDTARLARRDLDGINALVEAAHDWSRGREIAGFDPETPIGIRRWYRELEAIAREARIRTSSYPRDAVQLLTPAQAALRQWRRVYISGLNDGSFPRAYRPEEATISEEERRALFLPDREARRARERLWFHLAVATAGETLVLTTASADERGQAQVPSPFFTGTHLRVQGLQVRDVAASEVVPQCLADVGRKRDLHVLAARAYQNANDEDGSLTLWQESGELERVTTLWQIERARENTRTGASVDLRFAKYAGSLPARSEVTTGPSGLEAFRDCGFKFLAGRRWGLDPQTEVDEAAAYGQLQHRILEKMYTLLLDNEFYPPPTAQNVEQICRRVVKLAEQEVQSFGATVDERLFSLDLTFVREILEAFTRRDLHSAMVRRDVPGAEPATVLHALEMGAGSRDQPVWLDLPSGRLGLYGRIDRVEELADSRLPPEYHGQLVLKDYKSSAPDYLPPPTGFLDGRSLQLPLYAFIVEEKTGQTVHGFQEVYIAIDEDRDQVSDVHFEEGQNGLTPKTWSYTSSRNRKEVARALRIAIQAALETTRELGERMLASEFTTPPSRKCWGCRLACLCRSSTGSSYRGSDRPRARMPVVVSADEWEDL